jgi:peptide/nickel transport system permease protein
MPGDTARLALGARTPEATVEALRVEMHLRDPLYVQYYYWITDALKGELGTSIISKRPVLDDIKSYFPATLELVALSAIIMATFGILLGVLSTKYSGKWQDAVIRISSYLGVVSPAFLWAVLAMLLFAYIIPILPSSGRISEFISPPAKITGMYIIDYLLAGNIKGAADCLKHIIMPAVVLSFGGMSQAARITRSSMTGNMDKAYALAERAYGIPENKILFKYLLKPSLNSTVSVMALDIAGMVGGAFLVEQIFNYPGLSRYCLQAMLNKDVFSVSAVVLLLGTVFIAMNFLTDLLITFLDPRIRFAKDGE